jgi:ribosomal protein S18 acetylase RimI-like enzyme
MRVEEHVIGHLFIHVDYQRQGLGSRFIQQAKEENDFLSLSTFELNKGAQKFYDLMGFVITDRGYARFEDNPWATSRDQLADITYEWRKN